MINLDSMSIYLENKLINHLLRNNTFTISGVWLALYTASPSETKAGIEMSGYGYVRQSLSGKITITGNTAANSSAIVFPEATGDWGIVEGVAIMDGATYGNILFWAETTNQKAVSTGEEFSINPGLLTIKLQGYSKGGWGNGIANKILKHVLLNIPIESSASVYIATGSALSYDADYNFISWGETLAAEYGRKSVSPSSWYTPTNGSTCNLNEIVFYPQPIPTNWGRIENIVIYDSPTGGSSLLWGDIYAPIYITAGDGLKFPANSIDIAIN